MTNDFWAEDLPTSSFTSLNPSLDPDPGRGRHNFEKQKAVSGKPQMSCPSALPLLLAPAGVHATPRSSSAPSSEASVSFTTEVWPGRDVVPLNNLSVLNRTGVLG